MMGWIVKILILSFMTFSSSNKPSEEILISSDKFSTSLDSSSQKDDLILKRLNALVAENAKLQNSSAVSTFSDQNSIIDPRILSNQKIPKLHPVMSVLLPSVPGTPFPLSYLLLLQLLCYPPLT
jgi:capsule polysaccharide export protein KpsE/RkpR